MNTLKPLLTRYWDVRRQAVTFKVAIPNTNKFLLFSEDNLRDLRSQIDAAFKGNDVPAASG